MNNNHYFYRSVIFTRKNNEIALADIEHPERITPVDSWMGMVLSLADGKHTVQELIDYIGARYQQVPDNLEKTLHSVLQRLEEGQMIRHSETAVELPYYLAAPIEELDLEKARKLIKDEGYVLH